MKIQTSYIDREISYLTVKDNWRKQLPDDNWCLVLIANKVDEKLLDEIIEIAVSNNVGYICGIGEMHDYIHNQSDSEYVMREIGESKFKKPKYHIMTVGDDDFEEGIWYGLMCTFSGEVAIDKIQILDADCTWKDKLKKLIKKFEEGYLPENE